MPGLLFPKTIDNAYHGQWLALLLFAPVLLFKGVIGFNVAGLNPAITTERILISADGVPLGSYPAEAVAEIVYASASWGFVMVLLALVAVLALARYRALIPLVILLFTAEQGFRQARAMMERMAEPASDAARSLSFYINWGFTIALLLALALSLIPRKQKASGGLRAAKIACSV
ncbi:MAG: hypothetical protein ACKVS5_00195 [Parvularculaceae bacterium]